MPKIINQGAEDVPISLLKPHERNANQGDYGAIQESIQTNGFFGRLVVNRRNNKILAGNHRYQVALKEGFEKLPVEWVDVDPDQELRILLADNRTARLGQDNEAALAELLAELANTDRGLAGTGWDGDDLDRIIGDLARGSTIDRVNNSDDWVGMPEFEPGENALKIIINFENESDRESFAQEHSLQFLKKEARTWTTWFPFRDRQDLESLRYG